MALKVQFGNLNVDWDVNGRVITGECDGLDHNEGLTVRLELPEGYFKYNFWKENKYFFIVSFICAIFIIYADYLWRKYGKDDKPIQTVEFYPPYGLNSAELQFAYDGTSSTEGVMSLLIYLANQGYLKIEVPDDKKLEDSDKFNIIKLKEYDGGNEVEKMFFEGIFKKTQKTKIDLESAERLLRANKAVGKDITLEEALEKLKVDGKSVNDKVSSTSLKYKFYRTINKIKEKYSDRKRELFDKTSAVSIMQILIMIALTVTLTIIYPAFINGIPEIIFMLIFPIIAAAVLITGFTKNTPKSVKVFLIIWSTMFGGMPLIFGIIPVFIENATITEIPILIIGILTLLILIIFLKSMPKRNQYGTELLGKIEGFKNFLETAEKERLEALVFQDPNYFFNILPYTYSLRNK